MMTQQIRVSKSYLWSTEDCIRQEETGSIYKGHHRGNGDFSWIKVLNYESQALAEREYQVLMKLNHENVIKLLALEKDLQSNEYVMVMEYCNGGTLVSILEQPQNAFGISEKDFLLLLHDIAAGLKHLRDHNIVHRNINPRSITQHQTDDGRYVFKLSDFGTARHLESNKVFRSFYGASEYQFPEMFKRAFLGSDSSEQFTASVDLWSVGVTLFQAATGRLPFQPYEGAEKDPVTMYQMTSKKPSGCIAAYQSSPKGQIEWNANLPKTCRLSLGLRNQLMPLLNALLEPSQDKVMAYETFFKEVSAITDQLTLHVFDLSRADLLHIYCRNNICLSEFQTLIEKQSGVGPSGQLLLYENHPLNVHIDRRPSFLSCLVTSPENPIYLFLYDHHCSPFSVFRPELPDSPEMKETLDFVEDSRVAKQFSLQVNHLCHIVADVHLRLQLTEKAAKMFHFVLYQEITETRNGLGRLASSVTEFTRRIVEIKRIQVLMQQILSLDEQQQSTKMEKLEKRWESVVKIVNQVEAMQLESQKLKEEVAADLLLSSSVWNRTPQCHHDYMNCLKLVRTLVDAVDEIANKFQSKIQWHNVNTDEKVIHLWEKKNLQETFSKCLKLVRDNCLPNVQFIYEETVQQHSEFQNKSKRIETVKRQRNGVAETLKSLKMEVNKLQAEFSDNFDAESRSQEWPEHREASRHKILNGEFVFEMKKKLYKELVNIGVKSIERHETSMEGKTPTLT